MSGLPIQLYTQLNQSMSHGGDRKSVSLKTFIVMCVPWWRSERLILCLFSMMLSRPLISCAGMISSKMMTMKMLSWIPISTWWCSLTLATLLCMKRLTKLWLNWLKLSNTMSGLVNGLLLPTIAVCGLPVSMIATVSFITKMIVPGLSAPVQNPTCQTNLLLILIGQQKCSDLLAKDKIL